jgi:hypothetical protein
VFFVPQRRWSLSLVPPLVLDFRGRPYMRGGDGRSGPGWPHHWVSQPGPGPCHLVVWAPGCSPCSLLLATFVIRWFINF